jgi:hypothetical protein
MPSADILYHLPKRLTTRQCTRLEHILRHLHGVMSAQLCPNNPHTINVEYDLDTTDARTLLMHLRALDDRTTMLGL